MQTAELDAWHMQRALRLARRGEGAVEPNPMVGCVVAHGAEVVGEGWHRRYGGLHAEREALRIAGRRSQGATLYVTLEPCCHHGKTPPCTEAVLASGIARVVAAQQDPYPDVGGSGIAQLRAAGLQVDVGVLEEEACWLNAPYRKLVKQGRPWVIAKWAMTLDGKLATHTGDSRWISNSTSRGIVHDLRRRVDAVVVGRGTAEADDPLLTARPSGTRTVARVVLDSHGMLASESQLVQTSADAPVLVIVAPAASAENRQRLQEAGCQVIECLGQDYAERFARLLDILGQRRWTNVLVEGGSQVLGALFDAGLIDEVHAFVATKLVGGDKAPSPIGGAGLADMQLAQPLHRVETKVLDGDLYVRGFMHASPP